MTFEEKELFTEELFRRYLQNAEEEMTEEVYDLVLRSPYSIASIKGFFTASTVKKQPSSVQKANELMVKKCLSGITVFDYADLMYNASEEFREKWFECLEDFKDFGLRTKLIGASVNKKFKKYEKKLEETEFVKDLETYEQSWQELHDYAINGDLERVQKYINAMNVHRLRRVPMPPTITI